MEQKTQRAGDSKYGRLFLESPRPVCGTPLFSWRFADFRGRYRRKWTAGLVAGRHIWNRRQRVVLSVVLILNTVALTAENIEPRLTPGKYAVELGKAPVPLSIQQLVRASLEISGADAPTVVADTARFEKIIAEAKKAVAPYRSSYEKGDALLVFMHRHLLTRYSEPQTRIDTLLLTGEFNCVSSAVVYMILGRAVGLQVEGVYTPDHAFVTVRADGRLVDVETTNRYGFDPGTKTAFHDAFGNTGFTYVPPGKYRLRTATDGRGLLAFILQNRMSLLERRSKFSEAVGPAADRYAVLRTKSALAGLVSEVGNYCALLNQRGEYAKAIDFLDAVEKDYGKPPRLVRLMSGLVHNEVLKLVGTEHYAQARILIRERSASGSLDASSASSLKQMVAEKRLTRAVRTLPFADALAAIRQSYHDGDIPVTLYRRYLIVVFGKEAQATAIREGYLSAVKVLERGIRLTGGDSQLERGRQVYLNNYIATVHNRFVSLFNRRDYIPAAQVIKEGLKAVPDSSVLNQDLSLIHQATGGRTAKGD